jgi:hypothetical protein
MDKDRKTSRWPLVLLAALAVFLAGCGKSGEPASVKSELSALNKIKREDTPAAREVRAILQDAGSGDNQKWSAAVSSVTNLTENAVQGLADIVDALNSGNPHKQIVACLMLKKLGTLTAAAAPALQWLYQSPQEALRVNALIASEAIAPEIPWPWKRILADHIGSTNYFQDMFQAYGGMALLGAAKPEIFSFQYMTLGTNFESDFSVSTMTNRYGSPDNWRLGDSTNETRLFCFYGPLGLEVSPDRKKVRSNYLNMPDHLWLMLAKRAFGSNAPATFSQIPDLVLPASGSRRD